MKSYKTSLQIRLALTAVVATAALMLAHSAAAQLVAYDDAGNYLVSANWTNGANQGFGFTPWAITTNGPNSQGTYIGSANSPMFVIASVTNVLGTNYTDIWGTFANGPDGINETTVYRGFADPLGTNTFKLQWGSRGAGVTSLTGGGQAHGWCGFTLRSGNVTNTPDDFQTGVRFYLYFKDGNSPSTLYVWDGNGVQSLAGTSFSDLGRGDITNAVAAEITVRADGTNYHMILKDAVRNRTLYTLDSVLIDSGTPSLDSAALFCQETTGDQVYNRMQIAVPHVPPTIVNVQPTDGAIYLDPNATSLSFEVDSFNSTVASNFVSVYLNGVLQPNLTFNTADPTNQLLVGCAPTLAANKFYNYVITAQDANGNVATNTTTFNTFSSSNLCIDAMDYNYGAGQFIANPAPAQYSGLLGTNGIDYLDLTTSTNLNDYRPDYTPGDPPLPQLIVIAPDATGDPVDHEGFIANSITGYQVAFTDAGEWENYTRNFPASNYTVYARAASAGGGSFQVDMLANPTATTTNQPLAILGTCNAPNTGGSKVYSGQLTPLVDLFGNTVELHLSGTNTLRQTATQVRTYNLSYLMFVPDASMNLLRPYISVGSPAPGATAVSLTSAISFTIANRQTSVMTNTIQLFLNTTNVTSRLVLSSNAAGATVTWTPTNNLPSNFTNTVTVIFTDSGGASLTNSWNFVTGTTGGALGNGIWSGGGGADMNWSTAANWTGGTPGPGFNAIFASPGATATLVTNNIVSNNVTILGLFYNTNNSGYHTTLIKDGVTLTVTNGTTAITAAMQVGGTTGGDNVFNKPVTNTITGGGGTLLVLGNPQGSSLANQLNFQVRQSASPAAPEQTVLDMSGLGTLIATVGKFYVAQGGANTSFGQTNVSARVNLARTNMITCLRANAGQFEVGDSSGGTFTLPGSTLNLGITNALFVDTMRIGKQKATNNLVRFNPAFTNNTTPSAYIRGTNGLSSRLTIWTIGDADTETTVPNFVQGTVDLSGGKLDALVNTLIVARGETSASDTGSAQGTLTLTAGTLNVNNLTNGVQRANNTATESGIVNVNGTATLVSTNIILAQMSSGADPSLVTGTLNVTNGTVRGTIVAGGGVSTANVNGGTLVISNFAGTTAAPLTALNLVNASLHLRVDGNATTASVNATTVSASGTTIITIDSVANVTGPQTIHLISYTGADPYGGLSLAPLPAGYTGNLVDNSGSVDLNVTVSAPPPPPAIRSIIVAGGQVILSGTNNNGAGGTYHVLTSTNITVPLANWTVLTNGNFDGSGNFSSTNSAGTNNQRFFRLQVP